MRHKSILIIKPSSLGDIVHTLPAVAAIKQANRNARITWVINPEWAPLLRGNPDIDHVHIFPRGEIRGLGAAGSLLPFIRQTRRLNPDAAVDFQGLLRSALIGKLSGAPEVFGLSDGREGSRWFYNQVARGRPPHSFRRPLSQACGARGGDRLIRLCGSRCPLAIRCRVSTSWLVCSLAPVRARPPQITL